MDGVMKPLALLLVLLAACGTSGPPRPTPDSRASVAIERDRGARENRAPVPVSTRPLHLGDRDFPDPSGLRQGFQLRAIISVSAGGRATKVVLAPGSGDAEFDREMVEALGRWRFAPATENCVAVAHDYMFTLRWDGAQTADGQLL